MKKSTCIFDKIPYNFRKNCAEKGMSVNTTGLMTQGEYKERVKALGENVLGMIRVKD